MIGRRAFALGSVVCGLAPAANHVHAQRSGRPYRIGILVNTTVERAMPYLQPFIDELRGLGYIEGRDIVLEYAWAEGRRERYSGIAADLVRRKVDVIFAPGTEVALAAKGATSHIPVVAFGSDLVETGLVTNIARPGGNVTGIDGFGVDVVVKQLEWLKRLAPQLSRVSTLGFRGHANGLRYVAAAKAAAAPLGFRLHDIWIDRVADIDRAFDEMSRLNVEAVSVLSHPIFLAELPRIARLALRRRIAVACYFVSGAEAGGLLAYETDLANLMRRAAIYVDKILKGAAPADLPVEFATHFKLTINLKTAKALGITVPETILNLADRVIE